LNDILPEPQSPGAHRAADSSEFGATHSEALSDSADCEEHIRHAANMNTAAPSVRWSHRI